MTRAALLSISICVACVPQHQGTAQHDPPRATFRFVDVSLRASLDSLMRWFSVSVVYLDRDIEGKRVTASCTGCDLEGALERILSDTQLTWLGTGSQIILKPRVVHPAPAPATLAGSVTDSTTGQYVEGASVMLRDTSAERPRNMIRWCPTNAGGFYSLQRVEPGVYRVEVRALGYQPLHQVVAIAEGAAIRLDLALRQEEIKIQEITVEGHRTALLPAEGYARGTYIRATPTDQNQYFLDGARIYNPGHFGSVLSTFNLDMVTDVDAPVGGLPPNYGGNIGGILDLSMRDGSRQRVTGIAGAGSLGSQLAVEGPLGNATTFLISWRRGFPDPAVPFLTAYGSPNPLGTTEVMVKLGHRPSASQQVTLSGYAASDSYDNLVEEPGLRLSNVFGWENRAACLRWNAIASSSLYLSTLATYTTYTFRLEHLLDSDQPLTSAADMWSDFSLQEAAVRASAEHYYDENHTIRGGFELVRRRIAGSISDFSSMIGALQLPGEAIWEFSVHAQDRWVILPGITAGLGVRATSYAGAEGSFSSVDPRFSLVASLSDQTRLYTSLVTVSQFLHPYRNSGVFMLYPPIFWYSSTDTVKPSNAIHIVVGIQHAPPDDAYLFGAETFYRDTHDLHGFYSTRGAMPGASLTDALLFGSGRSYGLELSAKKRTGDLRWSASYTLSWAEERYDAIEGGDPIPSPFDRRHEVHAALNWVPAEGWSLNALCVLTLGERRTFEAMNPIQGNILDERFLYDVNGNRLPGFQRLEVEAVRRFVVNRFLCSVSLRLLNAYGLVDPYVWDLKPGVFQTPTWGARLKDLNFLPLFPTVNLTVRF